eukprot:TRINITY_DN9606_c0_g1_i1.p1 TRINITY_DN9606_c0_g1~~TRINITY_DN9606_c0_g1_i1.p1  ORF type:complete len:167 (-),score=29.56 TRINITY_DN9606_c0_g1_i1:17-517(-)
MKLNLTKLDQIYDLPYYITPDSYRDLFFSSQTPQIFRPTIGTFPHIDFMYLDPITKRLYLFQVTINLKTHAKSDEHFFTKGLLFADFLKCVGSSISSWNIYYIWTSSVDFDQFLIPTFKTRASESSEKLPYLKSEKGKESVIHLACLLYTSPSPRDATLSRMPSSA